MPVQSRLPSQSDDVHPRDGTQPEGLALLSSPASLLETTKAQLAQIRQPSLERFLQEPTNGEDSTVAELTADFSEIVVQDDLSKLSLWLPISWLQANPTYHAGVHIGIHRIRCFVDGRLKEPGVSENIVRWVDQGLNAAQSNVRENWSPEKEFIIGMSLDRTVVVIEDYRLDGTIDTISLLRCQILESVASPIPAVAQFRMLQTWVAEVLSQAVPFIGDEPSRRWWLKNPGIPSTSLSRWRVNEQSPTAIQIEDERNGVSYNLPRRLREDPSFDLVGWMRQECWSVYGPLMIEEVYFDESGKLCHADVLAIA